MGLPEYSPEVLKNADEIELENIIRQLDTRLKRARYDGPEYKLIERQLEEIRHGSPLGRMLMEEYENGGMPY
ncbi:hypothetical protein L6654_36965 [Bradyrhizobium sp. WYCCWR 13023]|uniref:Uncharacterized protein n=1 Tax=Bradyrhizobium zhengyangense TaxID=2911009 RepID=A0A9X1RJC4_9BRAD|nr:hypothetical protein [Bradyrhizobium zhengyangense]MCG2632213.1 hypothetical protein [Bradyrhizobium zhengyangense]MCG2673028.1 hypothetical protein [Bradyrhizobium zhengyangense]